MAEREEFSPKGKINYQLFTIHYQLLTYEERDLEDDSAIGHLDIDRHCYYIRSDQLHGTGTDRAVNTNNQEPSSHTQGQTS